MRCETPGTGGMVDGTLLVMRSGKLIQTPAFYKRPRKSDVKPIYINFCPFCGVSFKAKLRKFFLDVERAGGKVHVESTRDAARA